MYKIETKQILSIIWTAIIPYFIFATQNQTFIKTYGVSACGHSLQQTKDGGYIVAGYAIDLDRDTNVFLLRTDSKGDTIWTKTYGAYLVEDNAFSLQQTNDDGFVITGITTTKHLDSKIWDKDIYLIRTNNKGDTLWTKRYGSPKDDGGCAVIQTKDSGFMVAGYTTSFETGQQNGYLIKTDSKGDTLWTKVINFKESEEVKSIQQTFDGGFVFVSNKLSIDTIQKKKFAYSSYLVNINFKGDTLWTQFIGSGSNEVKQTKDSGFIIVGTHMFSMNHSKDIFIERRDPKGKYLWRTYFEGKYDDYGYSVKQTAEGRFIVVGSTESFSPGQSDIYLIRFNVRGDTLWTKRFGGVNNDCGYSIIQASDGGFVITGYIEDSSTTGKPIMTIIHTDKEGITEINKPNLQKKTTLFNNTFTLSYAKINEHIEIHYSVPYPTQLKLEVFDCQGRLQNVLIDCFSDVGNHTIVVGQKNIPNQLKTSGLKLLKLTVPSQVYVKKLFLFPTN